jgi:hypothetical protein
MIHSGVVGPVMLMNGQAGCELFVSFRRVRDQAMLKSPHSLDKPLIH